MLYTNEMRRSGKIVIKASILISGFCLLGLAGCASSPQVKPSRSPAAVIEAPVLSLLRTRLLSLNSLSQDCPEEIRAVVPAVFADRLQVETCPKELIEGFNEITGLIKFEDQATLEEILNSQCRLPVLHFFDKAIFELQDEIAAGTFLNLNNDSPAPVLQAQNKLKSGLSELQSTYLPQARWQKRNGDYLIAEEQLAFLGDLLETKACSTEEIEIEVIYHLLGSLEELDLILKDKEQKLRLEKFLRGMQKVSDEKVQEMFFPDDD